MIEAIAAEREPNAARAGPVDIDYAAAGAIAIGACRKRGRVDLGECGGGGYRVQRATVEGAAGTAARKGIEQLRCDLVRIYRNQSRQAGGRGPGPTVVGGKLRTIRSAPWRPHNRGSACVRGDRTAIGGIA